MAGNVIAALDEDTTKNVEFTADSNLETVLKKAVQNAGFDNLKKQVDAEALNAIDSDISKDGVLANVGTGGGSEETDKKESKATYIVTLKSKGMNDSTVVKQLASQVDNMMFGKVNLNTTTVGWADLPEYSHTYTDTEKGDYWYDFAYTAGIAVVDVSDADTGETTYVMAVTVTRTPTQTYKHA